ncbi:AAA family ATPase [Gimesia sp.]|uniref:AAA family ATPase n=1 Tax=Gimesia sp. TaxID=2024833 RepID=UPI0032EB53FC
MLKFNPFQPGQIVSPSMFAGRLEELLALEKALFQTKNGNPSHFLIHGERGIGKSSLLLYLDYLARGAFESLNKETYSFVTATIELEIGNTYEDIVRKTGAELSRSLKRHETFKTLLKKGWDFLTRWEVFGVKYDRSDDLTRSQLFEELCDSVLETSNRLKDQCDGVLLLIDECDKPSADAHLGEFAKIFTERLSRLGATNVILGLSGISNVLDKMRKSHESSLRVFQQFELEPLPIEEARTILENGIREANSRNKDSIEIDDDVVDWIAGRGSQGYPHFIQEYAYAAFDADTDNHITIGDLNEGVYRENGALAQLGKKYFENMYLDQIGSDDYRKVLQVMSEYMDNFVTKATLREETGLKNYTLSNAISALTKRNIVVAKKGQKGEYRLPSKSFAIWIKTYASKGE